LGFRVYLDKKKLHGLAEHGVCALRLLDGNPGANLKSISHKCYLLEVAFVWELTKETIDLPLGCLQGGVPRREEAARLGRARGVRAAILGSPGVGCAGV